MATTNLNIRIEKDVKDRSEKVFSELGLNMTTAINVFLRSVIRENGIPFSLKIDVPNEVTKEAIEDGLKILENPNVEGYQDIESLRKALGI